MTNSRESSRSGEPALVVEPAGNPWGSERVSLDMLRYSDVASAVVCCPPGTPQAKELVALNVPAKGAFIAHLHEHEGRPLGEASGVVCAVLMRTTSTQ